jgi:hypothetical protein
VEKNMLVLTKRGETDIAVRRFAGEEAPMRWRLLLGLLAASCFTACSGGPETAAFDDEDSARAPPPPRLEDFGRRPLPYAVGVYYDTALSPLPPGPPESPGGPRQSLRFLYEAGQVTEVVAAALAPQFSSTGSLTALSREAALAPALRGHYDFLLAIGLEAPASYDDLSRPIATAILEIVLWQFGGLPSWFVPSVRYATDTHLRFEVIDLNQRAIVGQRAPQEPPGQRERIHADLDGGVECPARSLSLWERARPFEKPDSFLLTILVPPMVMVPGDPARASLSLTDQVLGELTDRLGPVLRTGLVEAELQRPLRVMFLSPEPGARTHEGSIPLSFEVISRDAVPITALDVHVLLEREPLYRWQAGREELNRWAQAMRAGDPTIGRLTISLPEAVLLARGRNLIKVRALRQDGERVSRSAVYESRGE